MEAVTLHHFNVRQPSQENNTVQMRENQVTIEDVARLAGFSVATVSRVMHRSPRVSPEAYRRVREAIDHLGYTPNALARGLSMRVTHTVGVLVSSLSDPFWGVVVGGIEDQARREQYSVLIASSEQDVDRERQAVELFLHQRVDGIIVGASSGGVGLLSEQRYRHLPLVFVNNEHVSHEPNGQDAAASVEANLVTSDDTYGAILAVEHLLALGHRRIAYIGPAERASSVHRLRGYRSTLTQAGVPIDESLIMATGEGANSGELAAFRILAHQPIPTAFFCYDDMTALGALRAIRALNLRVPTDISVVGYDDILMAAYLDPPLTTVRQPMNEMGQQAMGILIDLLREAGAPRTVIVRGELVIRRSSGPAPAA